MNPMPIRILHVLGSAQLEASGIAEIVTSIASSLDRSKYLNEVIFLDRQGPLPARFENLGIRNHTIPWRHPYRDPLGYFRFRRFLIQHTHNILHFHWGGNRLQRLAHKRSKVIVHLHGRINESDGISPIFFPTSQADAVIATCHAVAKQSPHPITKVVYPGVDITHFRHQPPEQLVFGFAARLVRLKGAHILLQAVRFLSDEFPDLRLEIAGAGEELENLQRLAHSLGIASHVVFSGWLENTEEHFNHWSIFMQPSLEEGIGMGLLHAMAAGMPAIATSVGGVPEVIDDSINGRLVPPGNALALADAIRELLLSPAKRIAIGQAAAETIRHRFSRERMASQIASIYDEVLNARS